MRFISKLQVTKPVVTVLNCFYIAFDTRIAAFFNPPRTIIELHICDKYKGDSKINSYFQCKILTLCLKIINASLFNNYATWYTHSCLITAIKISEFTLNCVIRIIFHNYLTSADLIYNQVTINPTHRWVLTSSEIKRVSGEQKKLEAIKNEDQRIMRIYIFAIQFILNFNLMIIKTITDNSDGLLHNYQLHNFEKCFSISYLTALSLIVDLHT